MRRTLLRRAPLAFALLTLAGGDLLARAGEARPPLRICLESQSAPFSSAAGSSRGIDHEIAATVAAALERPLEVHWFEASQDDDRPLAFQAHALLSRADCDLIAGYPLTRDGLRALPEEALRPHEPGGDDHRVGSTALLASRPYLSLPLTIVSTSGTPPISRLEDLKGRRLAVERGSLASAIATVYAGAVLRDRLLRTSFEDDAIFRTVESGTVEAAFVELHRFEIYRGRHPATALLETGYRHALAVHTGFVGIAPPLIREVDRALRVLLTSGRIAEIVEARGLSYSPPGRPTLLPRLTPRLLARPEPDR